MNIFISIEYFDKYPQAAVRYILFFLLFGCFSKSFAQDYEPAGVVFKDKDVTVSIDFKISKNLCDPTSTRKSKWRYLISGKNKVLNKYLIWQMDYLSCDRRVMRITNSYDLGDFEKLKITEGVAIIEALDFEFSGTSVIRGPYNARLANSPSHELPREINYALAEPKYIEGDSIVVTGQKAKLKVIGTDIKLSPDSKWVWYKNSCGANKIGEGEEIELFPKENAAYFVRAENRTGQSKCLKISLIVDNNSQAADFISGITSVCKGGSTKLEVVGGRLGLDANWNWFEGSCNSKIIGTNNFLIVAPTKPTTYYVSAVGKTNTTECRSITIGIDSNYSSPTEIKLSKGIICEGEDAILNVLGGYISNSAKWVWYSNTGIVGNGRSLQVSPAFTTIYKVRGEGVCGNTDFIIKELKVLSNSKLPYEINLEPSYIVKNQKVKLQTVGGELATGSEWVWYKNRVGGKEIGRGNKIEYSFRKSSSVFMRAENACYKSYEIQKNVIVNNRTKDDFYFMNFGLVSADLSNSGSLISNVDFTIGFKKKRGGYLRGKFNIAGAVNTNYNTSDIKIENYIINDAYYKYNGKEKITRFALTGGMLLGSSTFMIYLGGGYGKKTLFWGIDQYSIQGTGYLGSDWAKNVDRSVSGPEIEAGFLLRLGPINIMSGINNIFQMGSGQINPAYGNYIDAHLGIGLNF